MPRKTKTEILVNTPIEDIARGGKKNIDKVRKALRTLRTGFHRRVGVINRSGEFSHALYQYEESLPPGYKEVPINKMGWNAMLHEIARIQSFFQGKTSNVKGIREFNLEQDSRIFGIEAGTPRDRMTRDERDRYWKAYNEYMNSHPNMQVESTRIQTLFGIEGRSEDVTEDFLHQEFDQIDKEKLFAKIDTLLEKSLEQEALEDVPNVRTARGKGPFRL